MNIHKALVGIVVFGALLVLAALLPDHGFTQAPYYQSKTITVIASTAPGGIGDNRVKAIICFAGSDRAIYLGFRCFHSTGEYFADLEPHFHRSNCECKLRWARAMHKFRLF